jgi:NADPH-dependent glutamate synthase beta subunit-like oxidoreductase
LELLARRPDEIAESKSEGVEFYFATNVAGLEGKGGRVERAVLVQTSQKRADQIPVAVKGTEQTADVRLVVIAIGYRLDSAFSSSFSHLPLRQPLSESLFPDRRWVASGVLVKDNSTGKLAWAREYGLRSSRVPRRGRLWVVGDALSGPSSAVGSMAQGRSAARAILEKRKSS